jgi:hypothetical protein
MEIKCLELHLLEPSPEHNYSEGKAKSFDKITQLCVVIKAKHVPAADTEFWMFDERDGVVIIFTNKFFVPDRIPERDEKLVLLTPDELNSDNMWVQQYACGEGDDKYVCQVWWDKNAPDIDKLLRSTLIDLQIDPALVCTNNF